MLLKILSLLHRELPRTYKVTIPKPLPPYITELEDFLFSYFTDQNPNIVETHDAYEIELERTDFCYCEDVFVGLGWLGIRREEVNNYYKLGEMSIFTLLESWIPLTWSVWLQNLKREGAALPEHLAIIHLDDHQDMMSPRIEVADEFWKDIITGKKVSLDDPYSVVAAINSGCIGVGSILTLLVHFVPKTQIFHLKQNLKSDEFYQLDRDLVPDFFLPDDKKRMSLKLERSNESILEDSDKRSAYYLSSNIVRLLSKITEHARVILHVDMDYFNNRMNGDSDWEKEPRNIRNNFSLKEQKSQIDQFFEALRAFGLCERIENISVGVSPSFYPVEYWEEATKYLLEKANNFGIMVSDLKKILE